MLSYFSRSLPLTLEMAASDIPSVRKPNSLNSYARQNIPQIIWEIDEIRFYNMKVEKKGFTGGIYTLLLDSLSCKMLYWTHIYLGGLVPFFFLPIFIFHFHYDWHCNIFRQLQACIFVTYLLNCGSLCTLIA